MPFSMLRFICILGTGLGLEMVVLVDIILLLTLFRTVYKHLAFSQFYYFKILYRQYTPFLHSPGQWPLTTWPLEQRGLNVIWEF